MQDTMLGAQIQTGPMTSLKTQATNLDKETKRIQAIAEAESKKLPVEEGEVCYKTLGMRTFSIGNIKFKASRYITGNSKEQAILDSCVERKLLQIETDNRKIQESE